ncbi:uncharacterized protein [Mytilus edulis]|uniref:uncharacterized protein isoform X5 n=1 Tax=Mytilus edulis TaxID=6550 RepID=UPI0039EE3A83
MLLNVHTVKTVIEMVRPTTLNFCCLSLVILLVSQCSCDHKLHKTDYPFDLDNAGNAIEGYVDSEIKEGSKVLVKPIEGHQFLEDGEVVKYLQVIVRSGNFTGDEEYVAENTDAFRVDENGFIIVNNTDTFDHEQVYEFYVVMFRRDDLVSDPVPFIVLAAKHKPDENYGYNTTAAVFAGVLICLIVLFALLIPFVVRAKRRVKQGKPVWKFGSHPSALDREMAREKGSQSNLAVHMVESQTSTVPGLKNRAMTEGDFYDNYGYRLEQEVEREKNELSNDLMAIASHVEQLDDADNMLQLNKKHHSDDSDSGLSSDGRGKGILKNGHNEKVYSIEMKRKTIDTDQKPKHIEESAHL